MCAARVRRLLGQYELCTARECKVHAEQTSRLNASEWTELRLPSPLPPPPPLPPPTPATPRRARAVPPLPNACVCSRYSKILTRGYKVLGATPAANAHKLTSHEEVSFLSLYPLFHRAPSVSLLAGGCLRSSLYRLVLIPSSGISSPPPLPLPPFLPLPLPLTVHYSSHS